jgi:hypothetical protein
MESVVEITAATNPYEERTRGFRVGGIRSPAAKPGRRLAYASLRKGQVARRSDLSGAEAEVQVVLVGLVAEVLRATAIDIDRPTDLVRPD